MPFSGVGFGELLIIGMIILIIFGPQRLPEISRQVGKAMREFKRGMNEIQRELEVADREQRRGAGERPSSPASSPARPDTSSREPRLAGQDAARPPGTQPARSGAEIPTFGRPDASGEPPPTAEERRGEVEAEPGATRVHGADPPEAEPDGESDGPGAEGAEERAARPDPRQSDLFS